MFFRYNQTINLLLWKTKRNKVFENTVEESTTSMVRLFEFNLHMTSNGTGQIMSIKNHVSDKNSVVELTKNLQSFIYTDKVYTRVDIFKTLYKST